MRKDYLYLAHHFIAKMDTNVSHYFYSNMNTEELKKACPKEEDLANSLGISLEPEDRVYCSMVADLRGQKLPYIKKQKIKLKLETSEDNIGYFTFICKLTPEESTYVCPIEVYEKVFYIGGQDCGMFPITPDILEIIRRLQEAYIQYKDLGKSKKELVHLMKNYYEQINTK